MNIVSKTTSIIKDKAFGVGLCIIFAVTALSFNHSYGIPVMLMGLLLGMAMSQLYRESENCKAGIDFTSSTLLRLGIVLIGFRFTPAEFSNLSWISIVSLSVFAALTIVFGVAMARVFGLPQRLGWLSGSAVGICGASAALAVSAVLDPKGSSKHLTVLTVAAVTSLSSVAMLVYPLLGKYLALSDAQMSYLLGASIHDVAQVVGAGYSVSDEVGDNAVLVKLIRILNLLPIIIVIALVVRRKAAAEDKPSINKLSRAQVVPTFLVAFIVIAAFNLLVPLPEWFVASVKDLSAQLILLSIVAIGLKTDMRELLNVGYLPLVLICIETVFLLLIVLGAIFLANVIGIL